MAPAGSDFWQIDLAEIEKKNKKINIFSVMDCKLLDWLQIA